MLTFMSIYERSVRKFYGLYVFPQRVLKSTNFLLVNLASTYCSYRRLVYTWRVGGNGKHMGSISTPLNGYVRRICSYVKVLRAVDGQG